MASRTLQLGGLLALAMAVASASACGDEFTSGDTASSSGSGGTGGGSPTAAASATGTGAAGATGGASSTGAGAATGTCADDEQVCLAVPNEWGGPVVVLEDATQAPSCGGNWSNAVFEAFQEPIDAPASCVECTCGAQSGGGCGTPQVTVYVDQTCNGGVQSVLTPGSSCTEAPVGGASAKYGAVPVTPGSCAPSPSTPNGPEPVWAGHASVCNGASAGDACEGGECWPEPDGSARLCIHQDGDQTCPAGWSDKLLFYRGSDDQRTCSACACGAEAGATCDGDMRGYPSASPCNPSDLLANDTVLPDDGTCKAFIGGVWKDFVWDDGVRNNGTCPASGGEASGEVVPLDPVTLCCRGDG